MTDSWTNFVLQCHNGHTLCSTCKTRVHNRCPTCRQELGDIRCLALEKIAESLELPCRYISLGCPEIFPYYSKLKHEAICNFRPYNCPYAGSDCSVVGDIPYLVTHLRDDHRVDMHSGCTFNHRYVKSNPMEVENATWMLTVSINSPPHRSLSFTLPLKSKPCPWLGWGCCAWNDLDMNHVIFTCYAYAADIPSFHAQTQLHFAQLEISSKLIWLTPICFYVRFSTVLVSIFVSILKPSSLVWLLFTWHSSDSWETKEMPGTTATAWR